MITIYTECPQATYIICTHVITGASIGHHIESKGVGPASIGEILCTRLQTEHAEEELKLICDRCLIKVLINQLCFRKERS